MSVDDTRTRILRAAGPVFAKKGFRQATVRDICQLAGVNVAAVNYYFGDKERLYIESVKLAHQMRIQQVPLPDWPRGTAPEQKIREFIRNLVTRMVGLEQAPWQARLMLREVLQPTAACKALVDDYFRPHFDRLLVILDELLPADTPAHRRRQIGFSIVGQCVYYRMAGDIVSMIVPEDELAEHYSVSRLADHIADFSLAALAAIRTSPDADRRGTAGRETADSRFSLHRLNDRAGGA